MATAKTKRIHKPNGTVYRKLAEDFPRFMVLKDDVVIELSHQERAMLRFRGCLPADLRADYDRLFRQSERPMEERITEFEAKLSPRRAELVGW